MATYITALVESKKSIRYDVYDLDDLTDMRRYVKAKERAIKNGFKFEVHSVVTKREL